MAENDEKSEFWEKADRIGWQAAFFSQILFSIVYLIWIIKTYFII